MYDELNFARSGTRLMKIAIASDHAGFALKESIKNILKDLNIAYEDLGPQDTASVDYPDYAQKVAEQVQQGQRGILCCGTGIGMSIAANKFKGVRAALCQDAYTAQMSREHNDSNVLVLGGRLGKGAAEIEQIVKTWVSTEFQGGRHQRRLEKITDFENLS